MRGQRSPYSILGLKPGAHPAQIDLAYRELMKRHHPDLPGGDAGTAAEINRAYGAIKGRTPPARALVPAIEDRKVRKRARHRGRLAGWALLAAATALLLAAPEPASLSRETPSGGLLAFPSRGGAPELPDTLDMRSLTDEQAIASAVSTARRMHAAGQSGQAARFSSSCHNDLAHYPSPAMLDHCVAFDAAMALLAGDRATPEFQPKLMRERHTRAVSQVSKDGVLAQNRIVSARREAERLLTRPAD